MTVPTNHMVTVQRFVSCTVLGTATACRLALAAVWGVPEWGLRMEAERPAGGCCRNPGEEKKDGLHEGCGAADREKY